MANFSVFNEKKTIGLNLGLGCALSDGKWKQCLRRWRTLKVFSLCSKSKEFTFETLAQKSVLSSFVWLQLSTGPKHHPICPQKGGLEVMTKWYYRSRECIVNVLLDSEFPRMVTKTAANGSHRPLSEGV
jgi:hypothetical protein